jgi:CheY-like chemotaxis protein
MCFMVEDVGAQDERILRVLVVDDNKDAANTLAMLVEAWGYEVRVAYDGVEGLEAAIDYQPACLLLDINMPRMDGYTLANLAHHEVGLEGATLVAITGDLDLVRAKEAGFDYTFIKPADLFVLEELLTMLDQVKKSEQELLEV